MSWCGGGAPPPAQAVAEPDPPMVEVSRLADHPLRFTAGAAHGLVHVWRFTVADREWIFEWRGAVLVDEVDEDGTAHLRVFSANVSGSWWAMAHLVVRPDGSHVVRRSGACGSDGPAEAANFTMQLARYVFRPWEMFGDHVLVGRETATPDGRRLRIPSACARWSARSPQTRRRCAHA